MNVCTLNQLVHTTFDQSVAAIGGKARRTLKKEAVPSLFLDDSADPVTGENCNMESLEPNV
jgi:hypothetical protein